MSSASAAPPLFNGMDKPGLTTLIRTCVDALADWSSHALRRDRRCATSPAKKHYHRSNHSIFRFSDLISSRRLSFLRRISPSGDRVADFPLPMAIRSR